MRFILSLLILAASVFGAHGKTLFSCTNFSDPNLRINPQCHGRSLGAAFTNSSSSPITVTFIAVGLGSKPSVNISGNNSEVIKKSAAPFGGYASQLVMAQIEPGATYSVNASGLLSSWSWYEHEAQKE